MDSTGIGTCVEELNQLTNFELCFNTIRFSSKQNLTYLLKEVYLAHQITIKLLNAKYNVLGWCSGKLLMIRVATVS